MTTFDEAVQQTRPNSPIATPAAGPPGAERTPRTAPPDAHAAHPPDDTPVFSTPSHRRPWKKPGKNLRDDYRMTLQVGFVIALALVYLLTQIHYDVSDTFHVTLSEQEVVQMEQIQQTNQEVKPPPPPRPAPPVEVANNVVIEEQALDFDASLDLSEELDVGAPPPDLAPPEPESDRADEQEIFVVVEEQPVLIGGLRALQEQIHYPEMARKAGIEGRVIVQFIVNENGDVINPTVVQGRHPMLDEEAVRVISLAKFTPGRQRGREVKVRIALPITFKLAQNR